MTSTTDGTEKKFLSSTEAALYLNIALPTLYSYTSRRIIPFYKSRRRIYFKIEDVDNFILNNRIKSTAEIEQEATRYEALHRK